MIGNRLKLARNAAGLSLRGLQATADNRVTAQAIGKYERNESMPSSGVLLALASALQVTPDYLLGDPALTLESIEFRKKSSARKKEEAHIQARALDLIERYLTVEEIIGPPGSDWDKPRGAPYPVRELADVESAARALREHWNLGIDPIPNLTELLEDRGVKLLVVDLENIDGVSATAYRDQRRPVPVIVVKQNCPGERQRFNLAHELAHLALSVEAGVDPEKAAHRFAGAFLAPREALLAVVGNHRRSISLGELFSLKKLFGMSAQALTYRCHDLGIISESLFRSIFKQISVRGWRRDEPAALPHERPSRFERLCYRALSEGLLSESKTAELLGVTVLELNRNMEEPQVLGR